MILVKVCKFFIYCYRLFLSPYMHKRCRFFPSCSHYALESLNRYGSYGIWLIIKRLGRCHPWGGSGIDLVPDVPTQDH